MFLGHRCSAIAAPEPFSAVPGLSRGCSLQCVCASFLSVSLYYSAIPTLDMSSYDRLGSGGNTARFQAEAQQLQQQAAVQGTMLQLTSLCWEKCIKRVDSSMSSSEVDCVMSCAGRYLDATQFIQGRMMKQSQQHR